MLIKTFFFFLLIIGISLPDLFAFNLSDKDSTNIVVNYGQLTNDEKESPENFQDFSLNEEWLNHLPVRDLSDIVRLFPGIVQQDGNLHIRAGDTFSTGFMLDDIYISNPYRIGSDIYIIPSAISSLNLILSGSDIEMLGSASGYFQNRLRIGSKKHQFNVSMETDQWADEGNQFLGTSSYQDRIFTVTAGGPITDKNMRYLVAVENQKLGDSQKRFSSGYSFSELIDMNPSNPKVARGFPDTVDVINYPEGFTPHNSSDRWALNSNFLIKLKHMTFNLTGLFNTQTLYFDDSPMTNILNDRLQYWGKWNYLLNGQFKHEINQENSYSVQLGYSESFRELNDDYFGNDWQSWRDSTKIARYTNGRVAYRDRWRPDYNYLFNGFTFTRDGSIASNYEKSNQSSWQIAGTYTNRMIKNNLLRMGFYRQKQILRQFSINPFIQAYLDPLYVDKNGNHLAGGYYESLQDIPFSRYYTYLGDIYGYDRFGNENDNGLSDGASNAIQPVTASAFIFDQYQFKAITFTLGLRYCYFQNGMKILRDPSNPIVDQTTGQILESEWENSDAKSHFSPSFGLNFVINSNNNLFFKFNSDKSYLYTNYSGFAYNQIISSGLYYISTNLDLFYDEQNIKTYEFGYTGILANFLSLKSSAYVSLFKYGLSDNSGTNLIIPDDGSTAYGLDLSIQTARFNRLMGMAAITFSKTEDEDARFSYQHSPVGFIDLDYRFGKKEGGSILRQSGVNLLFRVQSGHPYTLVSVVGGQVDAENTGVDYMVDTRSRLALEPVNASTTPWNYQFDLKIDKSFEISNGIMTTFYLRVLNLFNTKNVVNVYDATGRADDDGFINDPQKTAVYEQVYGERYLDLYKAINIENGQSYWSELGKQLYGNPRRLLIGVQINY